MCGLYAIISRHKSGLVGNDLDVFKQMMVDTIQRGDDSTGLFMTDYKNPSVLPTGVKVVGGPHNIYENADLWKEIERFVSQNAGAIIGHGRWATRGTVNAENAHPFQHEHITLVHNGTIHGGVSYANKGETKIEVDSHALCVAMAEKGVLEALADVRGAYAVIVHDAKEGCLYAARNDDRPLHVYSTPERHYIMSEGGFLDVILARYGKKIKDVGVLVFKPEQLIKWDLRDPKVYTNAGDISKRRLIKEAAEAETRAKEAEERRKKWERENQGRWQQHSARPQPERIVPAKELKEVSFIVQAVKNNGTTWRYLCKTQDDTDLFFLSDENRDKYIGRVGWAPIHSTVRKPGEAERIFVKHRSIKWRDEVPEPKQEEPAQSGTFRTSNGKSIPCDVWAARILNEGCQTCDQTFTMLDYRKVVLTDDDMLLCEDCAKEFSVGQQPNHKTVH